jgi:hypothetical protein
LHIIEHLTHFDYPTEFIFCMLHSYCKYYKENSQQPQDGDPLICWNTEKAWINRTLENHEDDIFGLNSYIEAGLQNFQQYDGVPITLKALLFSFYSKISERMDIEAFKRFYLLNYCIKKG